MPRATAGSHIESESMATSLSLTTLPPYATFGSIELMLRCGAPPLFQEIVQPLAALKG
jgi:hypothetical protein